MTLDWALGVSSQIQSQNETQLLCSLALSFLFFHSLSLSIVYFVYYKINIYVSTEHFICKCSSTAINMNRKVNIIFLLFCSVLSSPWLNVSLRWLW